MWAAHNSRIVGFWIDKRFQGLTVQNVTPEIIDLIYGYTSVSISVKRVAAQVAALDAAGREKGLRETAS
jgi:hypothetical protein